MLLQSFLKPVLRCLRGHVRCADEPSAAETRMKRLRLSG